MASGPPPERDAEAAHPVAPIANVEPAVGFVAMMIGARLRGAERAESVVLRVGAQDARRQVVLFQYPIGFDHAKIAVELHHLRQTASGADKMLQPRRQAVFAANFFRQSEDDPASVRILDREGAGAEKRRRRRLTTYPDLLELARVLAQLRCVLHLQREVRDCARGAAADHQSAVTAGKQPRILAEPLDAVAQQLAVELRQPLGLRAVAPQVVKSRGPQVHAL